MNDENPGGNVPVVNERYFLRYLVLESLPLQLFTLMKTQKSRSKFILSLLFSLPSSDPLFCYKMLQSHCLDHPFILQYRFFKLHFYR